MNTLNTAINSGKLTLVDFFATWCGPCKMMHPVLEQLEGELGGSVNIVKVDVDQEQDLSTEHRIMSVPTLMLFKDGEVVWRQSGAMPVQSLRSVIEQYVYLTNKKHQESWQTNIQEPRQKRIWKRHSPVSHRLATSTHISHRKRRRKALSR